MPDLPRLGMPTVRRLAALHRKVARLEGRPLPSTGGGVWCRLTPGGAWIVSSWFAVHALPEHPGLPRKSWTAEKGIEPLPADRWGAVGDVFDVPAGPGWPPGPLASPDAAEIGLSGDRPVVRLHGVAVQAPLWAGLREILALEGPGVMAGVASDGGPRRWLVSAPFLRVVVAGVQE